MRTIGYSILWGGGAGTFASITTAGIGCALTLASPVLAAAVAPVLFPAAIGVGLFSCVSVTASHYCGAQAPRVVERIEERVTTGIQATIETLDERFTQATTTLNNNAIDAINRIDDHVVRIGENTTSGLMIGAGCLGFAAYSNHLKNMPLDRGKIKQAIDLIPAGVCVATAGAGLFRLGRNQLRAR